MLDFARAGRGTCPATDGEAHRFQNLDLNRVRWRRSLHVLNSRDRVILVTGKAGVGKTCMMEEAVAGIKAGGHDVMTFAPSADASRACCGRKDLRMPTRWQGCCPIRDAGRRQRKSMVDR